MLFGVVHASIVVCHAVAGLLLAPIVQLGAFSAYKPQVFEIQIPDTLPAAGAQPKGAGTAKAVSDAGKL